MPAASDRDERSAPTPRAAVIVRNPCTTDARVLRVARTLRGMGFEPTVIAVVSAAGEPREEVRDGIRIVRLVPRSPLGRLANVVRRSRSAGAAPAAGASARTAPAGRGRLVRSPVTRLHRWLTTLAYYRLGLAEVRRMGPALVHCNDYNTMWIGALARLRTGAAVVYDSHELWADRNQRPEPRWWLLASEALLIRLAHRTLTTSPGYADVLARRYGVRQPVVVRNVQEVALSDPRPEADGDLVYVGAVTTNRGLEQAIDALAHAPGLRLRVMGPGRPEYRESLTHRAGAAGVADRVAFLDPVDPAQVVPAIRSAGAGLALIQPACLSYELSLPNKLFEYLAAGLPIVGSDLPVIGRFVESNGVGLVAPARDPAAIAAVLRAIMEPERNRRLRQTVAAVAPRFTWHTEARQLREAYGEALARAGGSGQPRL